MKYLLIIFLFLSPSLSWSKDVSRDDLVKRDGLFYEKFTDMPFTGNVTGKKQGKIIEGKPVGEFLTYYESGQLKEKINYKDGKKEGERILYYESGQLKDKINYIFVAHHLDDLYENFVIRLLRGSGLKGLVSFSQPESSYNEKLKILRPLIRFKKKDLEFVTNKVF